MKFVRVFVFLCSLVFANQLLSQSSRITSFSVLSIGVKSTLVEWTMGAGSTCLSLGVQRSIDGVIFKTVYIYPGVCGSEDEEVEYSWIDASPIPFAKNYYRLKLEQAEFTKVRVVDFSSDLKENQIIAFPNPSESLVNLGFNNPNNIEFDFRVYNQLGVLVMEQINRNGASLQFDITNLKAGIYSLEIRFKSGKLYSTIISKI